MFGYATKLRTHRIAVVVPCYQVEGQVRDVLAEIPGFVHVIIAIDDASSDNTGRILDEVSQHDDRLMVIHHHANQGVGGAVVTGYREVLRRDVDVVVKLDGDGQMDPSSIPFLVVPVLQGRAEYVKGNRFHQLSHALTMPPMRRLGNLGLSFLIKAASGYWNVFDPTNGYTAISATALRRLDLDVVEKRYLFETSMLVQLYAIGARIAEVPMPARYGKESSSLSVARSILEFPPYLLRAFLERVVRTYFWHDFTATSVFLIFGSLLFVFGTGFGLYHWAQSWMKGVPATAGTVMVAALSVILGFQLLLQALVLDIQITPRVSEWWDTRTDYLDSSDAVTGRGRYD